MKYPIHYQLAVETLQALGERLKSIEIPDYLRDTCELGLSEAEVLLAQWHRPEDELTMCDEYQLLDQVMRRIGFVDDMTRDLETLEATAS